MLSSDGGFLFVTNPGGDTMVPFTEPQTPRLASLDSKDPTLKCLLDDPHRAYTAEDLVKALTPPQVAKDPQKKAQAVEETTSRLCKLVEAGQAVRIGSGLFKARLFFDKEEKNIEHAFIGGMGNTLYRFRSRIFRLNIGVLSLYFIKDTRAGDWMVTVRDTTIGKDYSLRRRLRDGTYTFGSRAPEVGEDHYLQIEGKYIAKEHLTITISGDEVNVEDHNTLNGTRIDALTREGSARYEKVAGAFLQVTDPKDQKDPVKRGRFALEQLLHHHQNFETTFFSAAVDSLLLEGLQKAQKA